MVQHAPHVTEAVLRMLNPVGRGIEIAPYFDPFLLRSEFPDVLYTDYLPTEKLREKAALNPSILRDNVVDVDFVWTPGAPLTSCMPDGAAFDYAVASHVMEHVPNPVGWLNDILAALKVGGRVAIFLPDRRRNFDYFRNLTSFAELVHLWLTRPAVPTAWQVLDFMSECVDPARVGGNWASLNKSQGLAPYSLEESLSTALFVHANGNYIDVHATVWEPEHFVEVFERLSAVGIVNVSVSDLVVDDLEFAVVLTKLGEPTASPPERPVAPAAAGMPVADLREEMLFHFRETTHTLRHRLDMLVEGRVQAPYEMPDRIRALETGLGRLDAKIDALMARLGGRVA